MPLQDGAKCAMWSFDDRGSYAIASLTASGKDATGKYETDFSHKFCMIVGRAYENLKGTVINEGERVDIRILSDYETVASNGHKYIQAAWSLKKRWDKQNNRDQIDIKIANAEIIRKVEKSEDNNSQNQHNIPVSQPTQAAPAQNGNMLSGTVGLDFLNVPDNNFQEELPFK